MSDDEQHQRVKRYKLLLDPECDTSKISEKRKKAWEKAYKKFLEGNFQVDSILFKEIYFSRCRKHHKKVFFRVSVY